jgi:hypothetical protein
MWFAALLSLLASASPALAASARQDSSGLVVWIFLGFCALIVVAQLVPVVLMALGLIKGVASKKVPEGTEVQEAVKH